jgi:type VI secretion system protein ImpC
LPYGAHFKCVEEFNFEEFVDGEDRDKYLWMSAAWTYAERITAAFAKYGWVAAIRGIEGGGKVEGLAAHTFPTDSGVAVKCSTEIGITERREFELSSLGFLPLLHCAGRDFAVFFSAQSCQKPKPDPDPAAKANAELLAKFNYLLCVSRFVHYLKIMARDKISSFTEVAECQRWLNQWLQNYILSNPGNNNPELIVRHPLSDAKVAVQPIKGKPGWYEMVIWLGLRITDFPAISYRLVAEIPKPEYAARGSN